jgi:hypothetical protein
VRGGWRLQKVKEPSSHCTLDRPIVSVSASSTRSMITLESTGRGTMISFSVITAPEFDMILASLVSFC